MPDPAAATTAIAPRRVLAAAAATADTIVLDAPVPAVAAFITAQAMNALAHIHSEVLLLTEDGREHLIDAAWAAYRGQAHLPPEKRTQAGPRSEAGKIVYGAKRRLRCTDETVLVPVPAPTPMRVLGTARLPDFAAPPTRADLAALTDPSGIAAAYRRALGPPD